MEVLFWCLAVLAFIGFFVGAQIRNGHSMAYSAAICVVWILAALWWSGAIG